jgi:hypothetical protein
LGSRIEEDEPGVVGRLRRARVELGEQRAPQRVDGEHVEALVAHVRGGAGDRVEGPLDFGTDARLGRSPPRARCGRRSGAGEIEQVGALGVVQLKRLSQCFEHAVGRAADVSALQARVVRDAHAGQHRDLLTTQSRHPTSAVGRQPRLLR